MEWQTVSFTASYLHELTDKMNKWLEENRVGISKEQAPKITLLYNEPRCEYVALVMYLGYMSQAI